MSRVIEQEDIAVGMWLCLHSALHDDRIIQDGGIFNLGGTATLIKGGWKDSSHAAPQIVVAVEVPFVVLARAYEWSVSDGKMFTETKDMRFCRFYQVSPELARASIGDAQFEFLSSQTG